MNKQVGVQSDGSGNTVNISNSSISQKIENNSSSSSDASKELEVLLSYLKSNKGKEEDIKAVEKSLEESKSNESKWLSTLKSASFSVFEVVKTIGLKYLESKYFPS